MEPSKAIQKLINRCKSVEKRRNNQYFSDHYSEQNLTHRLVINHSPLNDTRELLKEQEEERSSSKLRKLDKAS